MERFSNEYSKLIEEVKKELLTIALNENEQVAVSYLHLPWFPGGQFSLSLIADHKQQLTRLVYLHWDEKYDLDRFSVRVYNLDRLCIKNENVILTADQRNQVTTILDSIGHLPETLDRKDWIVLDGVHYELTIKTGKVDITYTWRIENDDIRYFNPLIHFMKEISALQ